MRLTYSLAVIGLLSIFLGVTARAQQPMNSLNDKERADGWKLLFNGKTSAGWHKYNGGAVGEAWKVVDGSLFLDMSAKKGYQTTGGGDIVTDAEYENFELSLDWKIQACGNSGVIFNVIEDPKYKEDWNTGPEMQVLDNACHPDAKIAKHRAGNLYDLIESKNVVVKPAGEWNHAGIVLNKGHLELWLNGDKQVETQMFTPEWEAMVKASKFKDMPDFGKVRKGHLALQDHGNQVWFRNIKIKELK